MPASTPTPTDHISEGDKKCERNTLPADPYEDSHDGSSNASTATMDMDTTPTTETAAELITRMMGAGATGEQIAKALRDKNASEAAARTNTDFVDVYAGTTEREFVDYAFPPKDPDADYIDTTDDGHKDTFEYVNPKSLYKLLRKHGTVAICARCRFGKSTAIKWVIEALLTGKFPDELSTIATSGEIDHIVAVCCRKIHVIDVKRLLMPVEKHGKGKVHTRYDKTDDVKGKIADGALATTVNSVWQAEFDPARTLFLMDEVRSDLAVIAGSTIKHDEVYDKIEEYMIKCKYKILADADWFFDPACPEFMKRFAKAGRPYALMRYTKVKDARVIVHTNDAEEWGELLFRRVANGERLLIGFGSKKKADEIYKRLKRMGVVVRIYTGQPEYNANKLDFEPEFGGVDAAWENVQVVIMNGACTVAVDPQEWRCDHAMLYHCKLSMTWRDFFQLVQRVGRRGIGCESGQLRGTDVLVYMQSGATLQDEEPAHGGFDLQALKRIQIRAWKVARSHIVSEQNIRNELRRMYDSEEARRSVVLPEWLLDVRAADKAESQMNLESPLSMLRLSIHIHGWSYRFIAKEQVKSLPVFSNKDATFLDDAQVVPSDLPERIHQALINNHEIKASDDEGRWNQAQRAIMYEVNTRDAVDNAVDVAIKCAPDEKGKISPMEVPKESLLTKRWPTSACLRWSTNHKGALNRGPSLNAEQTTAAIKAATEAARRAEPTADESIVVSTLVADTVLPTADDVSDFYAKHMETLGGLARGEGDKESLLYKALELFQKWDPNAGLPSASDYAIMMSACSVVWRVWRATQGRTPKEIEALELASTAKTVQSKAKPKMHSRELQLFHAVLHCIGVSPSDALSGRPVQLPDDVLTLFNTPYTGSNDRFLYHSMDKAAAPEEPGQTKHTLFEHFAKPMTGDEKRVNALAERIVGYFKELHAIGVGVRVDEGVSIRKLVVAVLKAWGIAVKFDEKQRQVRAPADLVTRAKRAKAEKKAARAAAKAKEEAGSEDNPVVDGAMDVDGDEGHDTTEKAVSRKRSKKGKREAATVEVLGDGVDSMEIDDGGDASMASTSWRVVISAEIQMDPDIKRVAGNLLVKMHDGLQLPCRVLGAVDVSQGELRDPLTSTMRIDAGPSTPSRDGRVYVEEGDFDKLRPLLRAAEARVIQLEERLRGCSGEMEQSVIAELLSEAKGRITAISNVLQAAKGGTIRTTYSTRGLMMGRVYSDGPSIQRLGRMARAVVALAMYHDIDLVNAHPTIVSQLPIVKKNPQRFRTLLAYSKDREPFRKAVMRAYGCNKGWAKELFLRLLNGGTHRAWLVEGKLDGHITHIEQGQYGHEAPAFIAEFERECMRLMQDVTAERPDVMVKAREYCGYESEFSQMKCAFSYILGEVEDKILATMEAVAREHDWYVGVLLWDGGLLRKREGKTEKDVKVLLRIMEREIETRLGVVVKLEVKPLEVEEEVVESVEASIKAKTASKVEKQAPSQAVLAKRKRGRVVETEGAAKRCRVQ